MLPKVRGVKRKTVTEIRYYAAAVIVSSLEIKRINSANNDLEFVLDKLDIQYLYDALRLSTEGNSFSVDVYRRARKVLIQAKSGNRAQLRWTDEMQTGRLKYWQDCINAIDRILEYLNSSLPSS